jgi:hypothetical protein
MERDRIIELAANTLSDYRGLSGIWKATTDELLAFAALVREATIQECARAAMNCGRPVGASDGCTYIPGTSSDAAQAIRALLADTHGAPESTSRGKA